MRVSVFRVVPASLVAVALIAGGCSSSKKSGSTTGSAPTSSANAATGTPITVEMLGVPPSAGSSAADELSGFNVELRLINDSGGVKGHPIKVISCSNAGDAPTSTACARNATGNQNVIAWILGSSVGASVDPILDAGGLASIGGSIYSPTDATSKTSFTISGGIFNTIDSAKAAVTQLGAKRIGVPYIDVPAGAQLAPFINTVVKPLGGQAVGAIPIAATAADITPQIAAEVAAKPDVIVDGLLIDQFTKLIRGAAQQGLNVPFLVSTGVFDAQTVTKNLGNISNTIYFVDEFDHQSPGYQQFLSDMQKNNPSGSTDDSSLQGWMAIKLFAYAADHASSLTRQGILTEMNGLSNYDIDGLVPGLDYTSTNPGLGGSLPRIFNDSVWLEKFQGGKAVPVGSYPQISMLRSTTSGSTTTTSG